MVTETSLDYNSLSVRSRRRILASFPRATPIYCLPGRLRLKELATLNRGSFHTDYWALRDISFTVDRGETFCVVGENGCGKSTLLQICAGILEPTDGTATVTRPGLGAAGTRLRLQSRVLRQGQRLSQWRHSGVLHARTWIAASPKSRRSPKSATSSTSPVKTYSSGMVVRLAFRRGDSCRSGNSAGRRSPRRRRRLFPPALHAQGA